MSTEHTPGCILSKCLDDKTDFTPGCPLCQLQKAAPQLLEALKATWPYLERLNKNAPLRKIVEVALAAGEVKEAEEKEVQQEYDPVTEQWIEVKE